MADTDRIHVFHTQQQDNLEERQQDLCRSHTTTSAMQASANQVPHKLLLDGKGNSVPKRLKIQNQTNAEAEFTDIFSIDQHNDLITVPHIRTV